MPRLALLCALLTTVPIASAAGQPPAAFMQGVRPAAELPASLRATLTRKAGRYPLEGFRFFGKDSVLLVFSDSLLTADGANDGSWMFGPAVTEAEADGCPPEKVLARQLARALWRELGRPTELQSVLVTVHGTVATHRWDAVTMYIHRPQLEDAWVGDPESGSGR